MLFQRNFEQEERGKIVIYTTSLQVVRQSFDKSKRVKKILQNHCVRYEERDLNKSKESQRELKYRLGLGQIDVPHVFFDGVHIGVSISKRNVPFLWLFIFNMFFYIKNCDQLEMLSDQGVLQMLFKDLEVRKDIMF